MPYSVPSSPSLSPSPSSPSSPASPAMGHRRTRSCNATFSDEKGPGAFASLGSLPRRKPLTKKLFVLHSEEDEQTPDTNFISTQSKAPLLFLSLPLPLQEGSVPFPLSSPLSASPTDTKFNVSHSSSTPIILSNGKPLKPSLKSACASPYMSPISHLRAQSAPSTPSVQKYVHFAESGKDLETVRVYNRSGKPANISKGTEDTETETEADNSYFSVQYMPSNEYLPVMDPSVTSVIPNLSSNAYSNIHVESLSFSKSKPAALYGSILVCNVAFEKRVALRFTLDEWQTTSEVLCKHVVTLPVLPSPFSRNKTVGDAVGLLAANDGSPAPSWDRFSFCVHLDFYERKLLQQTVWFVGRFTCPLGEWWDNNDGKNYRVGFKRAPSPSDNQSSALNAQQKTFTAPSTMKTTPVTSSVDVQKSVFPFPILPSSSSSPPSPPPIYSGVRYASVPSAKQGTSTTFLKSAVVDSTPSPRPLAQRRGIPVLNKMNLTNYAPPRMQTQTPTPPRSRSGSLENLKTAGTQSTFGEASAASLTPLSFNTTPLPSPPSVSTPEVIQSPPTQPSYFTPLKNTDGGRSSSPPEVAGAATIPESTRLSLASNSPSSDLRAVLVKQWCFAQTPPPMPDVFDGPVVEAGGSQIIEVSKPFGTVFSHNVKSNGSSPVENDYAWWVSGGSIKVDYSASGNNGKWLKWSGDTRSQFSPGMRVGVGG